MAQLSLNVLGRAPIPGQAKTRLIPELGTEGAAMAHAVLLTHVAGIARAWSMIPKTSRLFRLWGKPDTTSPLFHTLALPEQCRTQPCGDLGEVLDGIVQAGLAEARAVFLLGGDAVSVDFVALDNAEAALANHSAVLIPAADGGYVLLGVRCHAKELFCDIPWGTGEVAEVTRSVMRRLGWSWAEIPGHWDVDSYQDWERFNSHVRFWPDSC